MVTYINGKTTTGNLLKKLSHYRIGLRAKTTKNETPLVFMNRLLLKRVEDEPMHEISNNVVCATTKASDQPAHTRSLIRAFASRLCIL